MSDETLMHTCNKCGGTLKTSAHVGEPVEAEGCEPYYPIGLILGCPSCNIIITHRLLITNFVKAKKEAEEEKE